MAWRFNAPPDWPTPPAGWVPPDDWVPDPSWPPAPPGWQFWIEVPAAGPAPQGPPAVPLPRRRLSGVGIVLLVLALLALGGLVLGAVVSIASWADRHATTQRLVTDAASASVSVTDPCGPITLREGRAGVVTTSATIRYAWRRPSVTSHVVGDTVKVEVSCPALAFGSTVELVVEVPPGGMVQASSSAGAVSADGLSADLSLHSSAGSVTVTEARSGKVTADSSAGSVSLTWAAGTNPATITATSSAGSVSVRVPDVPGVAYRVDADTSAGRTTVEVRTDPRSPRTIEARSSAGSVLVGYR